MASNFLFDLRNVQMIFSMYHFHDCDSLLQGFPPAVLFLGPMYSLPSLNYMKATFREYIGQCLL
jgi:hypothetical protein